MKKKNTAPPPTDRPISITPRVETMTQLCGGLRMREESRITCPAGITASPRVLEPFLVSRLGNSSHIIPTCNANFATGGPGAAAAVAARNNGTCHYYYEIK